MSKRPYGGRKPKFDEPSATIAIRVPSSIKVFLQDTDWDWRGEFISRADLKRRISQK